MRVEMTKVSSKGQVIIPKALRDAYHWEAGQELIAIDTGNGMLLKPKEPFPETTLDTVAGCLKYQRLPLSLEAMDDAICKGITQLWQRDHR